MHLLKLTGNEKMATILEIMPIYNYNFDSYYLLL